MAPSACAALVALAALPAVAPRGAAADAVLRGAGGGKASVEPSSLSEEEEEFRAVFQAFDLDGDGSLSPTELRSMAAASGEFEDAELEAKVQRIIEMFDSNRDGQLDYQEFFQLCDSLKQREAAFKAVDADGDGFISGAELRSVCSSDMPDKLVESLVSLMIQRFDVDGDGRLNSDEFVRATEYVGAKMEREVMFRLLDLDGDGLVAAAELRPLIAKTVEDGLTDEQVEQEVAKKVRDFDMDGDGQLNFEEFVNVLNNI